MAYLNAGLMSFVCYTLCCLLGWTTRGRHHCIHPFGPFHNYVWLADHYTGISPCSFASGEVDFVYVHRVWLSYTRDRRLKVSSERLGNEDKASCQRALLPRRHKNSCGNLRYGSSRSIQSEWRLDRSATTAPHYLDQWAGLCVICIPVTLIITCTCQSGSHILTKESIIITIAWSQWRI